MLTLMIPLPPARIARRGGEPVERPLPHVAELWLSALPTKEVTLAGLWIAPLNAGSYVAPTAESACEALGGHRVLGGPRPAGASQAMTRSQGAQTPPGAASVAPDFRGQTASLSANRPPSSRSTRSLPAGREPARPRAARWNGPGVPAIALDQ